MKISPKITADSSERHCIRHANLCAGRPFEAFVALGGYSYHSSEHLAISAARRRANKLAKEAGCPGLSPAWLIDEMEWKTKNNDGIYNP